jgi:hypothetical protein
VARLAEAQERRVSGWELRRGKDLRVIGRELRHMGDGKEIKKRFRKELTVAAAPMVPAVRASIARIPVKGTSGSTGLRVRLQKASRLMVRTAGRTAGVRVLVDPKKMPEHERSLPQMMEGLKPFKHPVYGNRAVWAKQDSHPYFFRVVQPLGIRSRVAVNRVLTSITRSIT